MGMGNDCCAQYQSNVTELVSRVLDHVSVAWSAMSMRCHKPASLLIEPYMWVSCKTPINKLTFPPIIPTGVGTYRVMFAVALFSNLVPV